MSSYPSIKLWKLNWGYTFNPFLLWPKNAWTNSYGIFRKYITWAWKFTDYQRQ